MEYDVNLLIFDRFRHVERMMRTGRLEDGSPLAPEGPDRRKKNNCCGEEFPRREILLVFLLMHREGVRQKTFADEIRLGPSTVSEMVVRLVQDGYVVQKNDAGDRRVKYVVLTEKGEVRARSILDAFSGQLSRLFGKLEPEDKQELIRLLDKMLGMESASHSEALGI